MKCSTRLSLRLSCKQRILDAVESSKRKRGFEIACAVILALATTASAWCAYQSKLWGGAQAARSNAAVRASRKGGGTSPAAALQTRAFDATIAESVIYEQETKTKRR